MLTAPPVTALHTSSHGGRTLPGRNGQGTRRSSRVTLRVPLQVYEPDKQSLIEESYSVKVSLCGGLIPLKSPVKQGQRLVVRNQATGETKEAQVVYLRAMHLGRRPVAIEFLEPSPAFWGLAFPPSAAPSRYQVPAESFYRS